MLQETRGPERKERCSRRKSKSPQIFYQKKIHPQDPQTRIEKEKKKEGEMLYSGSFRFMTLPSFGLKNFSFMSRIPTSVDK